MQGQLFTTDFLLRGITDLPAWHDVERAGYHAFCAELTRVFASRTAQSELNEAQTEDEIVKPILNALGFTDAWLPQVNIGKKGREDVPDYLVFADAERKADALTRSEADRPRLGLAVVEAKRWLRELDRRDEAGNTSANLKPRDFGAPSSQMLRYLSRIDVTSDRAVKWGMLTNGAVWRLYWQDARSRSEEFLELNLAAALGVSGVQSEFGAPDAEHTLKLFFVRLRLGFRLRGQQVVGKVVWQGLGPRHDTGDVRIDVHGLPVDLGFGRFALHTLGGLFPSALLSSDLFLPLCKRSASSVGHT